MFITHGSLRIRPSHRASYSSNCSPSRLSMPSPPRRSRRTHPRYAPRASLHPRQAHRASRTAAAAGGVVSLVPPRRAAQTAQTHVGQRVGEARGRRRRVRPAQGPDLSGGAHAERGPHRSTRDCAIRSRRVDAARPFLARLEPGALRALQMQTLEIIRVDAGFRPLEIVSVAAEPRRVRVRATRREFRERALQAARPRACPTRRPRGREIGNATSPI